MAQRGRNNFTNTTSAPAKGRCVQPHSDQEETPHGFPSLTRTHRADNVGQSKSVFAELRGVAVTKHIEKKRRALDTTAGRK